MGLTVSELVLIINILLLSLAYSVHSFDKNFPRANLSTVWTNNNTNLTNKLYDTSLLRIVILNISSNSSGLIPAIGCGFYGYATTNQFYFIVFAVGASNQSGKPKAVWVANRNNSVSNGATLELTSMGDLVLKDVDGSPVWSTNTSGHSVVGMRIDGTGNLILHSANDSTIWQSFDHPTDTWVSGQRLKVGQRLVASVSKWNRYPGNLYSVLLNDSFNNFIESNPPQMYANYKYQVVQYGKFETRDRNLVFLSDYDESGFAYIRLDPDGHLRHYKFLNGNEKSMDDILSLGNCSYPTFCGNYGICSDNICSCPKERNTNSSYFQPLDVTNPNLGCNQTTKLNCGNLQLHTLIELENVTYLSFIPVQTGMNIESCKQSCLDDCSCKAAVFQYRDRSSGNCSLPNNIFSLQTNTGRENYKATTFLKVEVSLLSLSPTPNIPTNRSNNHLQRILVPTLSVLLLLVMFALCFIFSSFRKRTVGVSAENGRAFRAEDSVDQVSGNPKRFAYEEIKSATGDFNRRLGGGGFGSVFEGCFDDGTKIAVKCLEHLGQGKKEFLAEVKTIGSIHHVNLVRLLGFCVENACHLVYEYMCNGSLDKWIYHRDQDSSLDWSTRRNIILDIAKGLSYLHEECQKRIVHLDIKPQNILLDGKFKAKVSDFGLARFIDRDQSQVLTAMRGTRGYLAPEWFSNRRISEKVDVYSFGVVVLEIMCGRKNLDYSQPEEKECLLHIVKKKAEEGDLVDIVDKRSKDMVAHNEEAVKIIRIAISCLQGDCSKRPSMSKVVKVLEGLMDVDNISDYSFLTLTPMELPKEVNASESAALIESILSGPR